MLVVVIDGLGGGIGSQLVGQIKDNLPLAAKCWPWGGRIRLPRKP